MTMSRRMGRRNNRGIGGSASARLASLIAMFDVAAFTAARNVAAGANVGSFQCWIDPTHLLEQGTDAVRVALPTSDAAMRGQLTCAFGGTHHYSSNKAASFWRGRHEAVNWEEWDVYVPIGSGTSGGLNTMGDTTDGVTGRSGALTSFASPNTNASFFRVDNASAVVAQDATGALTMGTATYVGFSATGGVFTRRVKSSANVLTTSNTPLAANPANTLRMGLRHAGVQGATMRWFGKFVRSTPFSAAQRAQFQGTLLALCGIQP